MHRDRIRESLAWGLAATLLLPILLAIVLGLGGLLGGLGDAVGSAFCSRIGLALGAVWLMAIAATTAVNAVAALQRGGRRYPPHRHSGRDLRRRGRGRRAERRRVKRSRRWLREESRSSPGIGEPPPDRPA